MIIDLLTYAFVAHDVEAKNASLREHDENVDEFLFEHIKLLSETPKTTDIPHAVFREGEATSLFAALGEGEPEEFLKAATLLTERLISEMDRRTSAGLLVFARFSEDDVSATAVLKLDVVSSHTGALRQVADGSLSLEAVRDVLDAPGRLQKGIITPDTRDGSDVIIADRLNKAADYFVRAFGLIIESRATEGTLAMIQAVAREVPDATAKVVSVLPKIDSGTLHETLDVLVEQVPELGPKRTEIEEILLDQQRPVRKVDTSTGIKAKVTAGAITIAGPAAVVDSLVGWQQGATQDWKIEVKSVSEPKKSYSK
jgi:hypothetical protein